MMRKGRYLFSALLMLTFYGLFVVGHLNSVSFASEMKLDGEELIGEYTYEHRTLTITRGTAISGIHRVGSDLYIKGTTYTKEDIIDFDFPIAKNIYDENSYQFFREKIFASSSNNGVTVETIQVYGVRWKAPSVAISPKLSSIIITEKDGSNSINLNISVQDNNIGETVSTYYDIDGQYQCLVDERKITKELPEKKFEITNCTIQANSFSEGEHLVRIWSIDSKGLKSNPSQNSIVVKVDRTNPIISDQKIEISSTTIKTTVKAVDLGIGLGRMPYRYSIGSNVVTGWISSDNYEYMGLMPNKRYSIQVDVSDNAGHINTVQQNVQTKAISPKIQLLSVGHNNIELQIEDENPDDTLYQIKLNEKYFVDNMGELKNESVWRTIKEKRIKILGLADHENYKIEAKAKNAVDNETLWSQPFTTITLSAPPPSPTGITATATDTTITIKWNTVPGAVDYEIETDGKLSKITQGTQDTVSKLNPGTPHTFKIRSRNAGGPGEWSEVVTKSTLPAKPAVPVNLSAVPLSSMVTLTWDNVPGATGYDVEVDDTVVSIGPNTSYKHKSLSSGMIHKYRVRSVNAGDKSEWSESVVVATLVDSGTVPTGLTAVATQSAIVLSWEPVANATGYDVEVDGVAFDNGKQTSYFHNNPSAGVDHKYRVKSKKGSVLSDWSALIAARSGADLFGAPNVKADVEDTRIHLMWNPVKDATGYEIEVDGVLRSEGVENAFVHDGLLPLTKHSYRVRAKGPAGDSSWCDLKDLTTAALPTPQNLVTTSSALSVQLSWDAVEGAKSYELECDGTQFKNISENRYELKSLSPGVIYRVRLRAVNDQGNSGWSTIRTIQTLGDHSGIELSSLNKRNSIMLFWTECPGASLYEIEADGKVVGTTKLCTFTITALEAGSKHTYRVRAAGTETWSKLISTSTLAEKSEAPSGVVVSATMTSLQLSWEAVPGAKSYDVEVDGVVIDAGDGKTYCLSKLTPGSSHKLRVRAKNQGGAGTWSALITKSTLSSVRTFELNSDIGDECNLILSGSNIQDLGGYTFTVTYNPDELEALDLCGFTSRVDTGTGSVMGTDITITQVVPGTIVFKKSGSAELSELWSSAVNSIKFTAKKAGKATVSFTIN